MEQFVELMNEARKKYPQVCQDHPQVPAGTAHHCMQGVAEGPLSQLRASSPSLFMWPIIGSIT
jgi:hypothetical protein